MHMMEYNLTGREMALVVIDMQKRYRIDSVTQDQMDCYIGRINALASDFRDHGRPVVFVRFIGGEECHPYTGEGNGEDFMEGLDVRDTDIIVDKGYMNGYRDTLLAEVLHDRGCDCILLAGTVTQYCVMSTYFASFDHGLSPYLAKGCCISTKEECNEAAWKVCKALTPERVNLYLEKGE